MLAGLLYCGAGLGVTVLRRITHAVSFPAALEQSLRRQDIPWLSGAIAAGGIAGPIRLMLGLARTNAAAASLLLTLEGAATALMAWFVFHENFDRRIALGIICLVAGAATLAWSGAPTLQSAIGPVAIVGACVMWGLDNNFTRKDVTGRSVAGGPTQGTVCWAFQCSAWTLGRGFIARSARRSICRCGRFSRLRSKPRVVRHGASVFLRGAHGAYFSTAPFPRRTSLPLLRLGGRSPSNSLWPVVSWGWAFRSPHGNP